MCGCKSRAVLPKPLFRKFKAQIFANVPRTRRSTPHLNCTDCPSDLQSIPSPLEQFILPISFSTTPSAFRTRFAKWLPLFLCYHVSSMRARTWMKNPSYKYTTNWSSFQNCCRRFGPRSGVELGQTELLVPA